MQDHNNSSKHFLYQKVVQNPKREVEFFRKVYRMIFKTIPKAFKEDFCGTGLLSCEWVKNNVYNTAVGLDFDKETIQFGTENNVNNLSGASDRVSLIHHNVLDPYIGKFDIVCSMNYSHFLLSKRRDLVKYFTNVRGNISKGVFVMDFFGGLHVYEQHTHKNQTDFYQNRNEKINFVNNVVKVMLNFRKEGEEEDEDEEEEEEENEDEYSNNNNKSDKKYETLFTYDFRVYSLIELREALEEAGFENFKIYIKDVSDDEENTFQEYKEITYDNEYFPELDRYNGYLISYIK